MLDQRLRRWPNITPALNQRLVFSGHKGYAILSRRHTHYKIWRLLSVIGASAGYSTIQLPYLTLSSLRMGTLADIVHMSDEDFAEYDMSSC